MYQFNPIEASRNIKKSFVDYITTSFNMADKEYAEKFREELMKEGYISKGPYLEISGSYKTAASMEQLIERGDASPLFRQLESVPEDKRELKMQRPLYSHQEQALLKAGAGKNLVVTTGTGSGKTECFLIPVIDALLREQEQGTLDAGVRAIVIYPMNALANDQMKRMRALLQNSNITFGLYNGNTEYGKSKALKAYRVANGKDARPLPNELICREQMQENPPHILITNYSMLEYMMLRPKDDKVFSGAKLRYIILDEAHVYRGTTGMETAMLMRRLRARISTRDTVQYILTSATLGGRDADEQIIGFAQNLCGVPFQKENIIRSQDAMPPMKEELEFPADMLTALADNGKQAAEVLKQYGVTDYAPEGDDAEKLYELLLHAKLFHEMIAIARTPVTVQELRRRLNEIQPLTAEQVIAFIDVCTKAEKGKTSLIKARYHFFVRALEGAYITLNKPRQLFLQPKEKVFQGDKQQTVFEAAICSDCGRIALAGRIGEDGYFHQVARKTDHDPDACEYFMIDEGSIGDDAFMDDEDEEEENTTKTSGENDYVVCPVCGKIEPKGNLRFGKICSCDVKEYISLKKVNRTKSGKARCAACGFGSLRAFYLGGQAATAVLGTELYEQLPDEIVSEKAPVQGENAGGKKFKFFNASRMVKPTTAKKAKQFLCFSDSRSEAATFANSMEKQYEEFLRRRAVLQVAQQLKEEGRTDISVPAFVQRMVRLFDANKTFDIWTPNAREDSDLLHEKSVSNAWIAMLNEMFNARRSTSLPSLGLLSFDYAPNKKSIGDVMAAFSLSEREAKALLNLLTMDAVYTGAIDAGKAVQLSPAEREYIFYSEYPQRLVLRKTAKSKGSLTGWAGHKRENGNYYPNSRMQRLIEDTDMSPEDADDFLEEYWNVVFAPDGSEYSLDAGHFNIKLSGDPELKFYRCKKCGRITAYNVKNHCASIKCDGELVEIDPEEENKDNHYVQLYRSKHMEPLQIKEHTAQLAKNQQTRYQQAFVDKDINALSCSTTFEMGVDVGTLETVYMRNVPPSPANYVQRAGRAGRALHSAAFVLTYAKLSSHDLTFYRDPQKIISGGIQAPVFELENEKVISRHIYAVALSKFFARHDEIYCANNQTALLNEGGYETLKGYLQGQPQDLKEILQHSVPQKLHGRMGINDFSWTEGLIGKDGVLEIAVNEFREEVNALEKELKDCQKRKDVQAAAAAERNLQQFRCAKEDGTHSKDLIDFLVRNNVLPKYGFPVDTVELQVNTRMADRNDETLRLDRDLQMAIAEYAPGAEVIADGQMYVSRYIRRLPGKDNSGGWEKGYYCKCPHCEEPNFTRAARTKSIGANCISCGKQISRGYWSATLEPRRGFWTEGKPRPAPIRRPERDYKTDDYYVGDIQRKQIEKMRFDVNGQEIELESTANDTMAVVGVTTYSVCPVCGYATDDIVPIEHKDARGYPCRNKESIHQDYRLSHTFKTFVAKISFFSAAALDYETMLSVMYALLEGLSRELGIERTDLKGCLHQILWEGSNKPIYSIVLYDAVAGGAGHVRRLVTKDAGVFQRVLKKALSVVENCSCDPSCYQCLRNYYNTKVHDQLNRHKAAAFLRDWVGEYVPVQLDEPDVQENPDDGVEIMDGEHWDEQYSTWKEYGIAYGYEGLEIWDDLGITKDCLTFPKLLFGEKTVEPDFAWPKRKVLVYSEPVSTEEPTRYGWRCLNLYQDSALIADMFKE